MERQHVYIDESGAFGYNFNTQSNSTHFIIAAVLVRESNLPEVEEKIEVIRKKYFQNGEIKSSSIKRKNWLRRKTVFDEIIQLPFSAYIFIVDKRQIFSDSGLYKNKKTFYKFLNQQVYQNLFPVPYEIVFHNDGTGTKEFATEFIAYAQNKNKSRTLFDEFSLCMEDSKENGIIQIADFISGCIAYCVDDTRKQFSNSINYLSIISRKLICAPLYFPQTFDRFIDNTKIDNETDVIISRIACIQAERYIKENSNSEDIWVCQRIFITKYLLFRFYNNQYRQYITANELIGRLVAAGYEQPKPQVFRNKIIAPLRDFGVLISSSPKGYKIPCKMEEVIDFLNQGLGIIAPMIRRLQKCCDVLKLGSQGDVDIINDIQFEQVKNLINSQRVQL